MPAAMKKIVALLFLGYLIINTGNCQLVSKPSLTVKDFETALTNAGHLRKILKKHNFKYSANGASEFDWSGTLLNPLYPDLRVLKSENWELKDSQDQYVIVIDLLEWEPDHAPQPDIIKTIRIMVKRDSKYADQMTDFLEKIKLEYPNKSKRQG